MSENHKWANVHILKKEIMIVETTEFKIDINSS